MSERTPSLDHIVVLVPDDWHSHPPAALTDQFTPYPGGTHGDGKTRNTLIVLPSGAYLELISFVPPEDKHREGHWWGAKPRGLIDWALTSENAKDVERAQEELRKAGSDWNYQTPKRGGRKRPDGAEVRWEVTFPTYNMPRGVVPFWCHDLTPRTVRVPTDGAVHPCGAVSADFHLVVNKGAVREWSEVHQRIIGAKPTASENGEMVFTLSHASPVDGSKGSTIVMREAQDEWEENLLKASGHDIVMGKIVMRCLSDSRGLPTTIDDSMIDGCGFRIEFEQVD
jgi:hypothetical protein